MYNKPAAGAIRTRDNLNKIVLIPTEIIHTPTQTNKSPYDLNCLMVGKNYRRIGRNCSKSVRVWGLEESRRIDS